MGKALKKSHIREAAFLLIFEKLFRDDTCDEIIESAKDADEYDFNEEVCRIFKAVTEKADGLDEIISQYSEKRKVERIGKVSLAVLRLAVYECLYEDSVPVSVAISEAVLLTEKYAFDADKHFVNGVLGSFARSGKIPERNIPEKSRGDEE